VLVDAHREALNPVVFRRSEERIDHVGDCFLEGIPGAGCVAEDLRVVGFPF